MTARRTAALVRQMELCEGHTLRHRIDKGFHADQQARDVRCAALFVCLM